MSLFIDDRGLRIVSKIQVELYISSQIYIEKYSRPEEYEKLLSRIFSCRAKCRIFSDVDDSFYSKYISTKDVAFVYRKAEYNIFSHFDINQDVMYLDFPLSNYHHYINGRVIDETQQLCTMKGNCFCGLTPKCEKISLLVRPKILMEYFKDNEIEEHSEIQKLFQCYKVCAESKNEISSIMYKEFLHLESLSKNKNITASSIENCKDNILSALAKYILSHKKNIKKVELKIKIETAFYIE